ncbi:MAG: glycosyltransferase family 2 protein [Paracoccaceae bacterium]|nr:glycosyltransferase family 2 protein [Paracoccaceae bacterium]
MAGAEDPVSAVVISFNGGDRLLACIAALAGEGDAVGEIILVDNGSDDGSAERAMDLHPALHVVDLADNPGPSVARNRGLETARNRRVLLVDADTEVTPGSVALLAHELDAAGAAIACPRLVFAPEAQRIQCDGAAPHFIGSLILQNANAPVGHGGAPVDVDGLISTTLMVDRDTVLAAGGFNEAFFFYFEDLEFGLRMRLLGHRILCVPGAVVLHDRGEGYPGLSFRGAGTYPARRAYLSMRNRILTIAICFHWRTILAALPAFVLYEMATVGFAASRGFLGQWARGWGWVIGNRRLIRQMRRQVQAGRVLRDTDVLQAGRLPLADGLLQSPAARAGVAILSAVTSGYWRLARVAAN